MKSNPIRKRISALLLCFALLTGLLTVTASAADNVSYIDANGKQQNCESAIDVASDSTAWNTGWYVVNGDVTISERITVTGDVNLILADGANLTAKQGITVLDNDALTIYGQTNGTGRLTATGRGSNSGIGGTNANLSYGTITINGGNITARGITRAAGIGGGGLVDNKQTITGTVTINGGTVNATGGTWGAGIGGGADSTNQSTITITGGVVTATGGLNNAGIGGINSTGGKIVISGGVVTATSGGTRDAISGTFNTGADGNAVIFTGGMAPGFQGISPGDTSGWNGVIFEGASGKVYGNSVTPTEDFDIPDGYTLTIPSGSDLAIPEGVTLTNNGKITVEGTITNKCVVNCNGTITGSAVGGDVRLPSSVTVAISGEGVSNNTAPYGSTITIMATIQRAQDSGGSVPAGTGTVDFYLGSTDGTWLGTAGVTSGSDGTYTATLTLTDVKWTPSSTAYTITACFSGIAGSGSDSGLAANTGAAYLTVTRASQTPPADNEGYAIDYKAETITANSGYELTASNPAASGENTLTLTPGVNVYVRKAETDTHEASQWTVVTIPARREAPTGVSGINESIEGARDGQITGVSTDMEYRLGDAGGWTACTGSTVTGLTSGAYYVRYSATDKAFAGAAAPVTVKYDAERTYALSIAAPTFGSVYTGYAQPEARSLTITNTGNSVAAISGVTVDSSSFVIGGSGSSVPAGGSISTWTIQPAAGLSAGTYRATITVTYDNNETATAAVSFTVIQRSGTIPPTKEDVPSTPNSEGWESIGGEINGASDGDKITVDMGGTTEVPAEIFEEAAGKDVDVTFKLDNGVSWTVNGRDIPAGADISGLDLGVSLGTNGISADVINSVTGEVGTVQITLEHDGEFGFALTLTAPLGRENAGYWANIYHYDEANERLTFETSARIAADGTAALRMTHASQYAIVIDDVSHALPFADVDSGDWFYEYVAYAYSNGLMDGVSGTQFNPDGTMTRAMVWAMLARIDGETVTGESWIDTARAWAMESGVSDGADANGLVTREQFATMLWRYAGEPGSDYALGAYTDVSGVSGWALGAMRWAVENGIVTGVTETTVDPHGTATRAQAAAMLMRYIENI